MNFIKKKLAPQVIGIIDIWTYKVRVAICSFHNRDIELIWYWEKRQDSQISLHQEFTNIPAACKSIKSAIKKAETDAWEKISEVIMNIPFDELFIESSKVNHIRSLPKKPIQKSELASIMDNLEQIAVKKHYKKILSTSGYKARDLKLIIGWVSEIKVDGTATKKLLDATPEQINLGLLNIFIPQHQYEIIQKIGRELDKKVIQILPCEFAITKLFKKKKDIVIVDIGNAHTSVIVQKDKQILWVKKVPVWIDALIANIQKNQDKTKIEIIKNIDSDKYWEEKEEFLNIFKDILIVSLEEILEEQVCPSDFFMIGWWANKFLKNYLQETNLNKYSFKIAKDISFVTPKIQYLENIDSSKSNLNIYAMMMSALDFIKKEKDPIEESLKKAISHIEKK